MKKIFSILVLVLFASINAQETANRFFYELTFKPKKNLPTTDKVITTLDIAKDKSIYKDFTVAAQDSIIEVQVKEMEKAGVWKDMSDVIKMPKFTHRIIKSYPDLKVQYVDMISMKTFAYEDEAKMDWEILPEKEKIGEYNTQKATTNFGGRNWTAWFSTDIPFPDGPYKFRGLPGLIVKLTDSENNYSWELKGNKTISDWEEFGYAEKLNQKMGISLNPVVVDREKFEKSYENFKADPLGEFRPYMTPELMNRTMPGSSKTFGEMIKDQEKKAKDFFSANNNPIEIDQTKKK